MGQRLSCEILSQHENDSLLFDTMLFEEKHDEELKQKTVSSPIGQETVEEFHDFINGQDNYFLHSIILDDLLFVLSKHFYPNIIFKGKIIDEDNHRVFIFSFLKGEKIEDQTIEY